MRISRGRTSRASSAVAGLLPLVLLAGAVGCRGSTPGVEPPAPGPSPRSYDAEQVFTVEVWGAQAPDTVVRFAVGRPRSIVLRHGPPDNTVFAELDIPAGALVPPGGGTQISLSLRPLPGVYGLVLESDASLTAPVALTFKYPVHFAAPSDSRARYATDVLFEQALVVAFAAPDGGRFQTVRSTRPASDNLQAMISKLGRYQIVAPR